MLVLSGEGEGDFLNYRRYSVIQILSRKFLNNSQSPRPHCVIPATPGQFYPANFGPFSHYLSLAFRTGAREKTHLVCLDNILLL